jgi:hypothetical protein
MRQSDHMYNYPDNGKHEYFTFKAETKTTHRTTPKLQCRYVARLSYQKVQKMWQDQLPLFQGTRARKLLSFRKYAGQEPYYDLCFPQKQRDGQTRFKQLSKHAKTYGRNQQYQSRNVDSEGKIIGETSWYPRRKKPP